MTVTLIIDQQAVELDNASLRTSKTIIDAMTDTRQTNIEIEVLPAYWPVIDIYLDFIGKIYYDDKGQVVYSDNLPIIDNAKTLALCFYMESFFEDHAFFLYLMKQAYDIWSSFFPYIEGRSDEGMIYMYSPYEFVPDKYRDDPQFFSDWLTTNANKQIVLDGNVTYYNYVSYYSDGRFKEFKSYHGGPGEKEIICRTPLPCMRYNGFRQIGYGISIAWYENGQLWSRAVYKDGKQDGLTEAWYRSGQIKEIETFKDGQKHGLVQTWSEDGDLISVIKYNMGQFVEFENFSKD